MFLVEVSRLGAQGLVIEAAAFFAVFSLSVRFAFFCDRPWDGGVGIVASPAWQRTFALVGRERCLLLTSHATATLAFSSGAKGVQMWCAGSWVQGAGV